MHRWQLGVVLGLLAIPAHDAPTAQQAACENAFPQEPAYRLTILAPDSSFSLRGDGAPFTHDRGACFNVTDSPRGFLHVGHPFGNYWPECRITPNRRFTLDLRHPVPGGGGTDRGLVVDNRPHIQVIPALDSAGRASGLQGMAVGESVSARYIAIAATGHQLRIYFNPTDACPAFITRAPGSTRGTVTRAAAGRWEITLPPGSIGRLIEGPHAGPLVDRGLYYFTARMIVERLE